MSGTRSYCGGSYLLILSIIFFFSCSSPHSYDIHKRPQGAVGNNQLLNISNNRTRPVFNQSSDISIIKSLYDLKDLHKQNLSYLSLLLHQNNISTIIKENEDAPRIPYDPSHIIRNAHIVLEFYGLNIKSEYNMDLDKTHHAIVEQYCSDIEGELSSIISSDIHHLIYRYYSGTSDDDLKKMKLRMRYVSTTNLYLDPIEDVMLRRYNSDYFRMLLDDSDDLFDERLDLLVRLINMGLKIDEDFPFFINLKVTEYILNNDRLSSQIDIPVTLSHYISKVLYPRNLRVILGTLFNFQGGDNYLDIIEKIQGTENILSTLSLMIVKLGYDRRSSRVNSLSRSHFESKFFTFDCSLYQLLDEYNNVMISRSIKPIINLDNVTSLLNGKPLPQKIKELSYKQYFGYASGYNAYSTLSARPIKVNSRIALTLSVLNSLTFFNNLLMEGGVWNYTKFIALSIMAMLVCLLSVYLLASWGIVHRINYMYNTLKRR